MFRKMRRNRQALSAEECSAVLMKGTCGVLALSGDDGYPYAVPLSYGYDNGILYFHCAKHGHKLDAIAKNPKASFCVIDQDQIVPEEYTSYFRSVIAFGKIQVIERELEKRTAIEMLALRYAPNDDALHRQKTIDREWAPLCMLKMTVEHLTGKQAIELTKDREANG